MRSQMTGQVNVEVDASPQEDLTKILEETREYYETVTNKNRRDLENWYQSKVERKTLFCRINKPVYVV